MFFIIMTTSVVGTTRRRGRLSSSDIDLCACWSIPVERRTNFTEALCHKSSGVTLVVFARIAGTRGSRRLTFRRDQGFSNISRESTAARTTPQSRPPAREITKDILCLFAKPDAIFIVYSSGISQQEDAPLLISTCLYLRFLTLFH